jgi:hypothetical protein
MLTPTSRIAGTFSKQSRALASQRFRSTSASQTRDDASYPKGFCPVYVQHVSKIALEHLQIKQSDWVMEKGLDRGLHINPDGTFTMNFPARKDFDSGRIWYDDGRDRSMLARNALSFTDLLRFFWNFDA